MLLSAYYCHKSRPSIRFLFIHFHCFVSLRLHTGENMMITPERKLKCYAVLWLLGNHAHLKQTVWWSTSLFSARPCSWKTRMWCSVVVSNLWGCINYQTLCSSSADPITKIERYRHCMWHMYRMLDARLLLCNTTIVHSLFLPPLPFQFRCAYEELMSSQTCRNQWFPRDLYCILTHVKCNRESM